MAVGGYSFFYFYNRVTDLQTLAGQMARAFDPRLQQEYLDDQRYELYSGAAAVTGFILAIAGAVKQETKPVQIQVSPSPPPPAPLRCKHCGAELRKEDVFCPKCGAVVPS